MPIMVLLFAICYLGCFLCILGFLAARRAAANFTQNLKAQASKSSTGSVSCASDDSGSPTTPNEEFKILSTPLNIDYSTKVVKGQLVPMSVS